MVNDDLNQLARRLERATSAEAPSPESLDGETEALREGWLALGQLLEADRERLGGPLRVDTPTRRRPRSHRYLMVAIAAAASLLIGVVAAWSLISGDRLPESGPGPVAKDPAETPRTDPPRVVAASQWDWGDSLDEEIAQAGQAMVAVQQDWYRLDDAFEPVYHGLEEMEEDIDDNTL